MVRYAKELEYRIEINQDLLLNFKNFINFYQNFLIKIDVL